MKKVDHRDISSILEGCKRLQRKSQKELYDLLFDPILISISSFRLHKQEAEDIMQETFIKVFNNIDAFDITKASIKTWASVIAKRLAINYCKSQQKRNLKYSIEELESYEATSPDINTDIDLDLVKKSIEGLPANYKQVFDFSVMQGMTHATIAEIMNISESSSRVYLSRAIGLLKENMKRRAS